MFFLQNYFNTSAMSKIKEKKWSTEQISCRMYEDLPHLCLKSVGSSTGRSQYPVLQFPLTFSRAFVYCLIQSSFFLFFFYFLLPTKRYDRSQMWKALFLCSCWGHGRCITLEANRAMTQFGRLLRKGWASSKGHGNIVVVTFNQDHLKMKAKQIYKVKSIFLPGIVWGRVGERALLVCLKTAIFLNINLKQLPSSVLKLNLFMTGSNVEAESQNYACAKL